MSSKSAAVRRMLARFDDSLWGAACGVLALFVLLYAALLVGGS